MLACPTTIYISMLENFIYAHKCDKGSGKVQDSDTELTVVAEAFAPVGRSALEYLLYYYKHNCT
jgi:hypothetical protein